MLTLYSLSLVFVTNAQVKPDGSSSIIPSGQPEPLPLPYLNTLRPASIRTWEPWQPMNTIAQVRASNATNLNSQFFDGLGRPLQTVARQASPGRGDIVTAVIYDALGRETLKYLPYVSATGDGNFKTEPFREQEAFMQQQYGTAAEKFFYTRSEYEPSALRRLRKTLPPGNSWAGSNRGTETIYAVNTLADDIKQWTVLSGTNGFGNYAVTGLYSAGELFKNIQVDEEGRQTIEFKDRQDKLVLKKVQYSSAPDNGQGSGYAGWLCTYYIYDDHGNLRCVIQPKGVEAIASSWILSDEILNEQSFRYEYDGRQRMILKKSPGGSATVMLYDRRDRLVYTQDGNMKIKNWWNTTLYDETNRPIATGIMVFTGTSSQLQQLLDGAGYVFSGQPVEAQGSSARTDLDIQERENGRPRYTASVSINFNTGFESEAGADFVAEISTQSDPPTWLRSGGNPIPAGAVFTALTITGYDSYDGTNKQFDAANNSNAGDGGNLNAEDLPAIASGRVRAIATQHKVWVIEDANELRQGQWLESINFFDDKGRAIQLQSDLYPEGLEKTTTRYTFLNKVACNYTVHAYKANRIRIKSSTLYDHAGRLLSITKELNDDPSTARVITKSRFDEQGRLHSNELGRNPSDPSKPLETLTYDYNIRGWLSGINRDYVNKSGSNNYFGQTYSYDQGFSAKLFNGNIAGQVWRTSGDGEQRAYGFSYDAVNRITGADFTQNNGGWNISAGIDFSVADLSYDANGNLQHMSQKGLKFNSSSFVDQLSYSYAGLSNRLLQVTDGSNDNGSLLGDFKYDPSTKAPAVDYAYDVNGNMVNDANKKMAVQYLHLNLPASVNLAGKGLVQYVYDANGNKLQKKVMDNAPEHAGTTTTLYQGGFIYQDDVLQFIGHEEGRIRWLPASGAFVYDYFLKDQLGNVRVVITEEQRQDIYPAATLENAKVSVEQIYYDIKPSQVVDKTPSTPAYTNNNGIPNPVANAVFDNAMSAKYYRLNSNTQKTGLGIVLRVMSGDRLDIFGKSFYSQNNTGGNSVNTSLIAADIISALLAAPLMPGRKGTVAEILSDPGGTALPVNNFLTNSQQPTSVTPRAFINYILLDEQLKFVKAGASPVSSSESPAKLKDHFSELQNIGVTKNGYLYVYCSNESPVDVYFDNLQVVHSRGPLLEENHYYPFGLKMDGISYKAANVSLNKEHTFQEQRFDDDLDMDLIQFKWRTYDPQTGRFLQIDPLADDYRYQSPYNFSENRVTDGREMEGLEYVSIHHYANGVNGVKMHYKSSDKEINKIGGNTSGIYNSASYGPLGKGVVHYYYDNNGALVPKATKWDQKQEGGTSDFKYHGLYSGPGSITKDGGKGSTNYDFSFQPIDWADAIAKKHDMDYAAATATGEKYAGFLEDVRTVQADKDMVQRIKDYTNPFKDVTGVETPFRTSYSVEMDGTMVGQSLVIDALATYKQWKIDKGFGNTDTYDKLRTQFAKDNPGTTFIIDLLIK